MSREPDWATADGRARPVRIYVVLDPVSGEPRYVGKTVLSLSRRLIQHMNDCTNPKRNKTWARRWFASLKRAGVKPIIGLLEIAGEDWPQCEQRWIEFYKNRGSRITNATSGGEGLHGHEFTSEHRRKIAAALESRNPVACEQCGRKSLKKPSEMLSQKHRFCCRACYATWQRGKTKSLPVPVKAIEAARAARLAMETCKRGHPLSGENMRRGSLGQRVCIECTRIHKKQAAQRRKNESRG